MTGNGCEQPRVRRNEWHALAVPDVGGWEPTLSVSVVIPAYRAQRLLPTVLAGLAAQTYPDHLLEVVVANDGPGALELPEVRPARTRVVDVDPDINAATGGWGRANACHTGALAAEGDVLHWLDADMLTEPDEVEAQLRWHHLTDYGVVLGHKWFVDPAPALALTPEQVRDVVATGGLEALFVDVEKVPHAWIETIYGRTDDLRQAGQYALRTHAGATASVHRALYLDAGGMDTSLRLGEDISLGHRLFAAGAFFVPDREAHSWHLGQTQVMNRQVAVNDFNDPFLADRSPALHPKRATGRTYAMAYLEVVLDAAGPLARQEHAEVIAFVDAVLAGTLTDVRVRLLGPWNDLTEERRSPLDDALIGARIVRATYAGDARVVLDDGIASTGTGLNTGPTPTPTPTFVLTVASPALVPTRWALERLLLHVEHTHDGVRHLLHDGEPWARVVRTAALARARRVVEPDASDEAVEKVAEELWGSARVAADDVGFVPSAEAEPSRYPTTGGKPLSTEDAWKRVDRSLRGRAR